MAELSADLGNPNCCEAACRVSHDAMQVLEAWVPLDTTVHRRIVLRNPTIFHLAKASKVFSALMNQLEKYYVLDIRNKSIRD